jgi:hypothetical protein
MSGKLPPLLRSETDPPRDSRIHSEEAEPQPILRYSIIPGISLPGLAFNIDLGWAGWMNCRVPERRDYQG